MIKGIHYKQFAQEFNRELSHYVDFTGGFNVTKFNDVLGVKDDQSLMLYLGSTFGQSAVDLVDDMLHYPKVEGINQDLCEVLDGKRHEFKIINGDVETGRIFYPFGIARVGTDYTVYHLPSGYVTQAGVTGEKNAIALAKEYQDINEADEASPDSETIAKLWKITLNWRHSND